MLDAAAGPPSQSFGRFTLLAKIATGGMGELFLARLNADSGVSKLLVIKRILPHLTDKPEFVQMFLDEARIAARITHPNVCQLYELGRVGHRCYMALEYLEGMPLVKLLAARGQAPVFQDPRLIVALVTQACEGLHSAHEVRSPDGDSAEVIHRDVNPRNIFVTSAGVAKVLDFGIAKARDAVNVTRTGSIKGTYSYMSPEQLRGEPLDRRSDVFSLGIVAWEALVGKRLFKRDTDFNTWKAINNDPIPRVSEYRPDVPAELDDAVHRALSRDPGGRFSTTRELAVALEHAVARLGGTYSPLAITTYLEAHFGEELESQRRRVVEAQRRAESAGGEGWTDDSNAATVVTPSPLEEAPGVPQPSSGPAGTPSPWTPVSAGDVAPAPALPGAPAPAPPGEGSGPATPPSPMSSVTVGAAAAEIDGPRRADAPRSRRLQALIAAVLVLGALFAFTAFRPGGWLRGGGARPAASQPEGQKSGEGQPAAAAEQSAAASAPAPGGAPEPDEVAEAAGAGEKEKGQAEAEQAEAEQAEAEQAQAEQKAEEAKDARLAEEADEGEAAAASGGDPAEDGAEEERAGQRERRSGRRQRANRGGNGRDRPAIGFLTLAAKPYGTVYVDGRKRGITPLVKVRVRAGARRIKLVSPQRERPKRINITIRAGEETRKRIIW